MEEEAVLPVEKVLFDEEVDLGSLEKTKVMAHEKYRK